MIEPRSATDTPKRNETRAARGRFWGVLAAAALLLGNGAWLSSTQAAPAGAASAPEVVFDASTVSDVLGRVNPHLSPRELERIGAAVMRYSDKYQLDPGLVTAVLLVESDARPWVRSPKGAMGLMQVMPHMMLPLGLAGNPTTIETNIEAGCWILAGNIERLGEESGISAYFWGSDIRGVAYLEKVLQARERVRAYRAS
ncbi:MAG: transglycosylase SLT domain-containing protein [Proteobacteria bacterium]|nr:transglycosylase SLT domain-containing protein [Pseudomonadota bacterium]